MADPLSIASMGMSAVGAGINAFGAIQSGAAQSQMYQYQAGVAETNQKIALQNRDYALNAGETEAVRYGMGAAQRGAQIKTGMSTSGMDIGSGSKADVQSSQQIVSGMDLGQIRNNAARKAYGYEVEAAQDTAQAGLYTRAASDAESAGGIKAFGSLVSGAGSVADKWLQRDLAFGTPKVNQSNSNYSMSSPADPWAGLRGA